MLYEHPLFSYARKVRIVLREERLALEAMMPFFDLAACNSDRCHSLFVARMNSVGRDAFDVPVPRYLRATRAGAL